MVLREWGEKGTQSTLRSRVQAPGARTLSPKLERCLLKNRSVKTHSENHGRLRRRKSPDAVNSKLIMAAVRLWELKKRNACR
jgi:hypothetical protein